MRKTNVITPFKKLSHVHQQCADSALSVAEETCNSRGVRLTKLRRRVLELVWSSHEPIKAYDILDILRNERSGSAPPTVYRALEFLQDEGMVHKIESLNSYVGCGAPAHNHASQFLICHSCGAVAEMDDIDIRNLIADKAADMGFKIDKEIIEVKGICSQCSGEYSSDKKC
ncbi:MAG: transcriptional repressor [Proteobacteria bacterium]|nr:transcriptional repressor [Pseudomonadota bacterium]